MAKNIVSRIDRNLGRRLREARRETGLSTRAVAAKLPRRLAVSHTTIASYENATAMPPIHTLAALSEIYGRSLTWFLDSRETFSPFRYHNPPSRVSAIAQRTFEALASKWTDAYVNLEKHLKPRRERKHFTASLTASPQELAATVRKECLGIDDDEPVENMVHVLESFSAWALELRPSFAVDAASARRGDEFVVVLNPDVANDRLRLTAAHELAHLLYDGCRLEPGWSEAAIEKRAYAFASWLLLPESQIEEAFKERSFLKLLKYKERFGVSLSVMIYRAEIGKKINTTAARWLWKQMALRGWRQQEPGYVWRDRAITFETMLESAIHSRHLSWPDAERITGIRQDELQERISNVTRTPNMPQQEGEPVGEGGGSVESLKFVEYQQG